MFAVQRLLRPSRARCFASSIKLCWGSQTGTARSFAEQLKGEIEKKGMKAETLDLADFAKMNFLQPNADREMVVLLMACYGKGEPTDNARGFYNWLMTSDNVSLPNLSYCLFGLGSSKTFPDRYNVCGERVDKRLSELGATRITPFGRGDDSNDIEADFDGWVQSIIPLLSSVQGSSAVDGKAEPVVVKSNPCAVEWKFEKVSRREPPPVHENIFYQQSMVQTHQHAVHESLNLTPLADRFTQKVTLSCEWMEKGGADRYEAGDHLGIFPENTPENVRRVVDALVKMGRMGNIGPDDSIEILSGMGVLSSLAGTTISVRECVAKYCNITSVPSPALLRSFAGVAASRGEASRLEELSGRECYTAEIKAGCPTVAEIFEMFPSVRLSPEELIQLLPRMNCRYYSIASSAKVHPDFVSVAVRQLRYQVIDRRRSICPPRDCSLTSEQTPVLKDHLGVCSNWLASLSVSDAVPSFIRPSSFRLPSDPTIPIVMLAGGVGIAPFIGFLQERDFLKQNGSVLGPAFLFYGMQNENEFAYRTELEEYVNKGIVDLIPSFGPSLVTDSMTPHAKHIWSLLKKDGHGYVCGGSGGFGNAAQKAFSRLAFEAGDENSIEASTEMWKSQVEPRFHEDLA